MRRDRVKYAALAALGILWGCGSAVDKSSGSNANTSSNGGVNNGANVVANNAEDGGEPDLSALEWSLVGTWRTCSLPDDRCRYYIVEPDRDMCTWEREGDNFGVRFDEAHFSDWRLHEDQIDDHNQYLITAVNDATGEEWDTDRYNPEDDRMFHPWIEDSPFGMAWVDNIILCSDDGISSVASDIERLGVLGNGDTTDTRLNKTTTNSDSEPPGSTNSDTPGSTNSQTNGAPAPPGD